MIYVVCGNVWVANKFVRAHGSGASLKIRVFACDFTGVANTAYLTPTGYIGDTASTYSQMRSADLN